MTFIEAPPPPPAAMRPATPGSATALIGTGPRRDAMAPLVHEQVRPIMGMSIETRDVADGQMVSIAGELDVSVVEVIQQALEAALARRPEVLRIDLANVRLLDSRVMATLWLTYKTAVAQDITVLLCNPTEFITHVLDVAGLLKVLPVERDHNGGAVNG